jgi:hypothetical protein
VVAFATRHLDLHQTGQRQDLRDLHGDGQGNPIGLMRINAEIGNFTKSCAAN